MNTDSDSGHGGAREGAGRPPIDGEKKTLKLPRAMVEYLDSTGPRDRAQNLRNLLDWAANEEVELLPDPGFSKPILNRQYVLLPRHIEFAENVGDGSRTPGVRRVLHTAMTQNLDLTSLQNHD